MSKRMNGGQALIAALVAHGVDTTFGIPGTHNLSVFAAMAEFGIRNVTTRHEQGAGFAADGYARSTGRPGIVITTTGAPALNAAAAAAQAYSDSVPVLFISPNVPLRRPAFRNGSLHEVRDQRAVMGNILRGSYEATSVSEIPIAIAQCFTDMLGGRPQPVHLSIPLDVLNEIDEVDIVPRICLPATPVASQLAIRSAVEAINKVNNALMIVGGGAFHAVPQIIALSERIGACVITTQNGKGTFPEDHPFFVGTITQGASCVSAMEQSDILIGIGTEFAQSDWWDRLSPALGQKLVRIDIDPAMIVTNLVPEYPLVGDASATIDALLQQLDKVSINNSSHREYASALRRQFEDDALVSGSDWKELLNELSQALPRDAILAADDAMVCYNGALATLPMYRAHGYMFPTGGGMLGFGLPAAIGAKVANPDTAVVALLGDGGAMFTIQELATAAQLGIALPIIIVDNGGYGEIRNEMADRNEPQQSVALGSPDFAMLGKSLGCYGIQVDSSTDMVASIKNALTVDRPTVFHVRENSRAAKGMFLHVP